MNMNIGKKKRQEKKRPAGNCQDANPKPLRACSKFFFAGRRRGGKEERDGVGWVLVGLHSENSIQRCKLWGERRSENAILRLLPVRYFYFEDSFLPAVLI